MENFTDPRHAALTEETLYRLSTLFEFASPDELREYLLEIYHHYIIHELPESLPNNFSDLAQSMQLLFDFLKFLKEEMKSEPTKVESDGDY